MSTENPAAQAIIQALSAPGLDDAKRQALVLALQAVLPGPAPTPDRGSNSRPSESKPMRVRAPAAPKIERKAEQITFGKESVDALPLPESGERLVYDSVCPQLAVRLRPGGKSYIVVMWDSERHRKVARTLGKVDRLTPENARKQARALVADVSSGVDIRKPAVDGLTVAQLIAKWQAEKRASVRTVDELVTKMIDYLGPVAHRSASEVSKSDIGIIHSYIATKACKRLRKRVGGVLQWVEIGPPGLRATADKWRVTLSSVFTWGMKKGLVVNNPAAGIDAAFDAKGAQRSNYLRGDELTRFWKAMEADPDVDTRDVFLMLLHTGQRRGNVLEMQWAEVDLGHGIWTLSAAKTKQNKVQTTPLTAQARQILARRYESASTEWVFPATRAKRTNADDKTEAKIGAMSEARLRDAWTRICGAAGITGLRIHDLRHTTGSWLARLGANEAIRQKALGHQTSAMAARYSHLELDPVADALQRMGDAIEAAATKKPATVEPMKRKKK